MEFKFDEKGLICVIVQDAVTGRVLMQAYMNKESLDLTLETGVMHYFSRSRQELWKKGETSGNIQRVVESYYDCDADALLFKVLQTGAACHTDNFTCFYRPIEEGAPSYPNYEILFHIMETVKSRKENPKEGSYTNYLFNKGTDKILKKIGEESTELIVAAKNKDKKEMASEMSDLLYHIIVLAENEGMDINDVFSELSRREGNVPHPKYGELTESVRNREK